MQMKAYMKRTGSYMETTRLTVTVICLLLLLVVSPLYGRRYDMAIIPNIDVDLSSEVGAVLRDAGGSVNINYAPSYFTADANLNKFSRYKPVAYPALFDISDADRRSVGHGITIDTYAFSSFEQEYIIQAAHGDWKYRLPVGGENEPFRLSDFKNYYTDAVPPIQAVYPASGWEINNTSQSFLDINFDLDPDDSTYNLQAYDLIEGKIDLRECYFEGVLCDYNDNILEYSESSDTILDSYGNLQSDYITFRIDGLDQMQPAYRYRIYLCMYYYNSGKFYFIPLPKQGDFNPAIMYLNVSSNAEEGGGGIDNPGNDIAFSPSFGHEYYRANECTDEFSGNMVMSNTTGELLIRVKLTNTSNFSATFKKNDFRAYQFYDGDIDKYPTYMFEKEPGSVSGGVTSISVPANGSKYVWFYFQDILYNIKTGNINTTVEMNFNRSGKAIWNGALNYYHGSVGWTSK